MIFAFLKLFIDYDYRFNVNGLSHIKAFSDSTESQPPLCENLSKVIFAALHQASCLSGWWFMLVDSRKRSESMLDAVRVQARADV